MRANKVVKNLSEYPEYEQVKNSIHQAFLQVNDAVNHQLPHDVRFSGSTCVSLLTFGQKLFVANVGDSRAILISAKEGNEEDFTVRALTRDHKPDEPDESKRILAANGRVDSYRDSVGNKVGPDRVWL